VGIRNNAYDYNFPNPKEVHDLNYQRIQVKWYFISLEEEEQEEGWKLQSYITHLLHNICLSEGIINLKRSNKNTR